MIREGQESTPELFSTSDHVVVCGYGSTGKFAARDLAAEGVRVVVVDRAAERVSLAREDGHMSLLGDVLVPEVLREAGVERARGIIFVLPSESDNLFATMSAREQSPDIFILARYSSPHAADKLLRAGADRAVNPSEETGRRIGDEIVRPAIVDLMRIFSEESSESDEVRVREVKIDAGSGLVGQSLKDAEIRARLDIMVIAMRKTGDQTRFNPDPDRPFEAGDVLVCMGRLSMLRELHLLAQGGPD
jgi:voltage-gated potassium channel